MADNREPLATTWGTRYSTPDYLGEDTEDSFDFSGIDPDTTDATADLLIPYFEVSMGGTVDGIADIEFFYGNPDDVPLLDTTFDGDFIA